MNNLTAFQFEGQEIRVVILDFEPWFIAADVAKGLSIARSTLSERIDRMPDEWKKLESLDTLDVRSNLTSKTWLIKEPAVYELIFRSDKPEARKFQILVFEEILPSIRKTGKYSVTQPTTEPQEELPKFAPPIPTPAEISEVVDLMLGNTNLHPNLIAGAKGNAIARLHPQHAITIEAAKSALSIPIEAELVRPTALAERLSETTGESWTAIRVNKLLLEQGFQIKNPDGKNPAYLPTEKGKEYGQLVLDTAKGHGKTIQSLQWHLSVLEALEANDH